MKKLIILILLVPCLLKGQQYIKNSDGFPVYFMNNGRASFIAGSPNYNDHADSLFARQLEDISPAVKMVYSNTFDILDSVWSDLYAFYAFAGENDTSILENWIDTAYTITYPAAQKPYFFKYEGISSYLMRADIDAGYANTNLTPSLVVNNDSATYGVVLNDDFKSNFSATTFGATASPNNITTQIGRAGAISYTNIHANSMVTTIAPSGLIGNFHFVRDGANLKVYKNNILLYNNTQTLTAPPNRPIYLGASNVGGLLSTSNKVTISFFYVAKNLSAEKIAIINRAIDYFKTHIGTTETVFENDYCYYKINQMYGINNFKIIWQDDNKILAAQNDTLYYSIDTGRTFPYKRLFVTDELITNGIVFSNGNISITDDDNKIYTSIDSLDNLTQKTLQDGGGAYTFHTPANAIYNGAYYKTLQKIELANQIGTEIAVFGGYVNNNCSAAPVNIYYSADAGSTWKVAYKLGIDSSYRDNGVQTPSAIAGVYLGDATNTTAKARHIHDVTYSSIDTAWYVATGDAGNEIFWLKGKYNIGGDSWTWTKIATTALAGRFKSTGLNYHNDSIYFASDDNISSDQGIFRVKSTELTDVAKHTELLNVSGTVWNMIRDGDTLIALVGNCYITYSKNNGYTWTPLFRLTELPNLATISAYTHITKINSDGWYAVSDNGESNTYRRNGGTIMIKLK